MKSDKIAELRALSDAWADASGTADGVPALRRLETALLSNRFALITAAEDAARLTKINSEICYSHNTLLIAGSRLQDQRDEARKERDDLQREVEALRAALQEIRDAHLPDQAAAHGGSEYDWAVRHIRHLRCIALNALTPPAIYG